ncbi:hypothetical protein [Wenzhouxiangella limi]|uniref:DNA-directed DNA polymerase n=1 Tax=Wenzhouxiangella limi TaxID=2707351 RepID=A0A845UY61_9GAMM|nr:hypothetical protein [Wenzhouxiangella limi]
MTLPWLKSYQRQLDDSLTHERLGHAPMVHGPAGLGKRGLARWLTARILCLQPAAGQPCGQCQSCRLLESDTHPDLFIAAVPEDKTQLPVDVIRDLTQGLQLTPSIGSTRVGLVEEADRMNRNAGNALLKTLEEPSSRAWLILVSDDPDALPATVLSRCQKIIVHPPDGQAARTWLRAQAPEVGEPDIDLALQASGGAPLRALELLEGDGLAFGREIRQTMLDAVCRQPPSPAVLAAWSTRPAEAWHWLAHWVRDFMDSALAPEERDVLAPDPIALARLWQQALEGRAMAGTPVRADLLLGKWLLEWGAQFGRQS